MLDRFHRILLPDPPLQKNGLINWTDPVTGLEPNSNRNVYDAKGRILQNDQVGTIKFDNTAKIYQPTGMTLSAAGMQNYNNDLIQTITYNENNDPTLITGQKAKIGFEYGLTNMRQRMDISKPQSLDPIGEFSVMQSSENNGGVWDPNAPIWKNSLSKFYSEDGSFEVVKIARTGQEKHILYIGGSPYESNIIYLKDYGETTGSYKYLHKDYLGSILAISDEAGNKLEQRYYDAWGNFTHLKVGNGAVVTDKATILNLARGLLIDRGYTSHEHLLDVGLIHMNGRLYDPLLRRFLNADENIQDPNNTQIYNKYGYAVNNPLMYNDPSGEILPFLVGIGLSYFWSAVVSGAIVGVIAGIRSYIVQAFMHNNFSIGGFVKSIFIGAVTGAVSAGIGPVFQAGGVLVSIGNGAISGSAVGGISSLIAGDNFLKGLAKGAAIGAVSGTLSWGISKAVNAINITRATKADHEYTTTESDVYNNPQNYSNEQVSYSTETIDKFQEGYGGLGNYGVKTIYNRTSEGYGLAKNNLFYKKTFWENMFGGTRDYGNTFGVTKPENDIYLSPGVYSSKAQFVDTITHETGHVIFNKSSLANFADKTTTKMGDYSEALDTMGHISIRKMSINLFNKNPWLNKIDYMNSTHFQRYLLRSNSDLDKLLLPLIKPFKF